MSCPAPYSRTRHEADAALRRARRRSDPAGPGQGATRRDQRLAVAGHTADVRNWALNTGFETGADGNIPEQAITAYNQTHPDHPY